MASAFLAIFSLTRRRLLEHANVFGTGCNLYGIGVPKRKRIDWGCRPRTARAAMTIAHGLWCSRHLYLDRPAKAFALVCHMPLPSLRAGLVGVWYQTQLRLKDAARVQRSGPISRARSPRRRMPMRS